MHYSSDAIWHGRPSHWIDLRINLTGAVFILGSLIWRKEIASIFYPILGEHTGTAQGIFVLLMLLAIGWRFINTHFHAYEVTPEVFRERFGIFNRQVHELEFYRVRDTATLRPLDLNILGMGHVILISADTSTPTTAIQGVKNPDELRKKIRELVEAARRAKGIVELA